MWPSWPALEDLDLTSTLGRGPNMSLPLQPSFDRNFVGCCILVIFLDFMKVVGAPLPTAGTPKILFLFLGFNMDPCHENRKYLKVKVGFKNCSLSATLASDSGSVWTRKYFV